MNYSIADLGLGTWPPAIPDVTLSVGGPLGSGGYGEVYHGTQEWGRDVCVKILGKSALQEVASSAIAKSPYTTSLERQIERLWDEAQILAVLHSARRVPFVIHTGYVKVGRHDWPYLVMEWIDGPTLEEFLESGTNPWRAERPATGETLRFDQLSRRSQDWLLDLWEEIARGLGDVNRLKAVHLDVSPRNVMVVNKKEIKLIDFGLGNLRDDQGTVVLGSKPLVGGGSPDYMAPEQLKGEAENIDFRADVYALGGLGYLLLTGKPPRGGTKGEMEEQAGRQDHHEDLYQELRQSGAPAFWVELVCKCLKQAPGERYADACEVVRHIDTYLADTEADRQEAEKAKVAAKVRAEGAEAREILQSQALEEAERRLKAERRARRWAVGTLVATAGMLVLALVATAVVTALSYQKGLALNDAREQKKRADDNSKKEREAARRAWGALTSLVDSARERSMERREQLSGEDRAYWKWVIAQFREFSESRGDGPEDRERAATAHVRIGQILHHLGAQGEAKNAYQEAEDAYRRLLETDRDSHGYRAGLSKSLVSLGLLFKDMGEFKDAETAYDGAIQESRDLVGRPGGETEEHLTDLYAAHHNRGILLGDLGRRQEAKEAYAEALQVGIRITRINPGSVRHQFLLATTHSNLGNLLRILGLPQEAENSMNSAKEALSRLPKAANEREHPLLLSTIYHNRGVLLREMNRGQAAAEAFDEAVKIRKDIASKFPLVPEYRLQLASSLTALGELRAATGRRPEAGDLLREAFDLQKRLVNEHNAQAEYQDNLVVAARNLAGFLSEAGRRQEAADVIRTTLEALPDPIAGPSDTEPVRFRQAVVRMHRASLSEQAGRPKQAEADYGTAIKLLKQLAQEFRANAGYRLELARSHAQRARLRTQPGWRNDPKEDYDQAISICQELADAAPASAAYRLELAQCCHNRGIYWEGVGQSGSAEVDYGSAIRHCQAPAAASNNLAFRNQLALSHYHRGAMRHAVGQRDKAEEDFNEARSIYEKLSGEAPEYHPYRLGLAKSHYALGRLFKEENRLIEAETSYSKAIELCDGLRKESALDQTTWRELLGKSLIERGILKQRLSQQAGAKVDYDAGIDLMQASLKEDQNNSLLRSDLAKGHYNRGNLRGSAGQSGEAKEDYDVAIGHFQLTKAAPDDKDYHLVLAQCYHNRGNLLRGMKRPVEAEKDFRTAIVTSQRLVDRHPGQSEYGYVLATSLNSLGSLLMNSPRSQESEDVFQKATEIAQKVVGDTPDNADYRNLLAGILGNRAALCSSAACFSAGQHWRAREFLEKALPNHKVALKARPLKAEYVVFFRNNLRLLAKACLNCGDHAEAARTARLLARLGLSPATDNYNAACYLAQCALVATRDACLLEAQRQQQARSYADEAILLLRVSKNSGYKDLANMKQDKALDPLRQRNDFRKLLEELEAAGDPR